MHIYILPQCSTTAASVLNSAGMDAQFERSCCAISRGILRGMENPEKIFIKKHRKTLDFFARVVYTLTITKPV